MDEALTYQTPESLHYLWWAAPQFVGLRPHEIAFAEPRIYTHRKSLEDVTTNYTAAECHG